MSENKRKPEMVEPVIVKKRGRTRGLPPIDRDAFACDFCGITVEGYALKYALKGRMVKPLKIVRNPENWREEYVRLIIITSTDGVMLVLIKQDGIVEV